MCNSAFHSTVIRISVLPATALTTVALSFCGTCFLEYKYIYIYGGRSRLRDRFGGALGKIELPMMSEGDLRISWEDAVRLKGRWASYFRGFRARLQRAYGLGLGSSV